MNYTEKEKKGIDKVNRMNEMFDKILMPAIGILIIILLIAFIVGKLSERADNYKNAVSSTGSAASQTSELFALRDSLLDGYDKYSEAFAQYGYEKAEGYSQRLALCKTVDEELTILQLSDDTLGNFSILRYTPKKADYSLLSLTAYSQDILHVMLRVGDDEYKVTFTSTDFSKYSSDDKAAWNGMMNVITKDDLIAMYELFEADVKNLSELCF